MSTSLQIQLPDSLKDWLEREVIARGYSSASDFVREMLWREQTARIRDAIDDQLTEGLDSGDAKPMTDADWERIRMEGMRLAEERRKYCHVLSHARRSIAILPRTFLILHWIRSNRPCGSCRWPPKALKDWPPIHASERNGAPCGFASPACACIRCPIPTAAI